MSRVRAPAAIAFCILLTAQMPGWKPFIDREGNRYFLDQNGKIYLDVDEKTRVKPVSSKSIDYNMRLADEMIREHRKADALLIWKSILLLKPDNMRIVDARRRASEKINALMRKEGTRFPLFDEESANIFVRDGDMVRFHNDFMRFSIDFKGSANPLRKNIRRGLDFTYHGLTVGVKIDAEENKAAGPYDYLAAFDSELFKVKIRDVESYEDYRKGVEGKVMIERRLLLSERGRKIYEITAGSPGSYAGYELYSTSGNTGTILRLITPESEFSSHRDEMKRAVESFRKVDANRGP